MIFSMKHTLSIYVAVLFACLSVSNVAHAAGSKASESPKKGQTNSVPEELPIPQSVFDLTIQPSKDPFFPMSQRQPVPLKNAAPAFSASSFVLKGLSGPVDHRLALVNNRTVAAGEDAEVTTPSGKVKIHCVAVKETSVVLRVSSQSETVEVALRKGAQ